MLFYFCLFCIIFVLYIYGLHVLEVLMYCFICMNNCVNVYSSLTVMDRLNVCIYPIERVSGYYKSVCMKIMLTFAYHRIYAITYTPEIHIYICRSITPTRSVSDLLI